MFVAEYSHSKSYFDFEVADELPEEGILKGREGDLKFKRIKDGFAVYDSTLLTSGFIYPGSDNDVYVPHTINDIPVTELHQTIILKSRNPFTIESGNLKRVFIKISKSSLEEQIKSADNTLGTLLLYMLREQDDRNQKDSSVEAKINFCGNHQHIELCSVVCICNDTLVFHIPDTKAVEVNAHKIELRGSIPSCVEQISFSGKVYPFIESGWDMDEPNNRCFENLKNIRIIDGSLSGDICWTFCNCTSLESVHLSNGIKKVPAYAFSKCSSLRDLYIPDTVSEIGAYAFSGCTNLVSIHLPPNLKKISEGTFKNCKSLKKVYLADTIETIEDYAFSGCVNLQKPWIPTNIKYISETAFSASE